MRFYLHKVHINRGGYDDITGSYWGIGQTLWECFDENSSNLIYFRAVDRATAKQRAIDELWTKQGVREENVSFFR